MYCAPAISSGWVKPGTPLHPPDPPHFCLGELAAPATAHSPHTPCSRTSTPAGPPVTPVTTRLRERASSPASSEQISAAADRALARPTFQLKFALSNSREERVCMARVCMARGRYRVSTIPRCASICAHQVQCVHSLETKDRAAGGGEGTSGQRYADQLHGGKRRRRSAEAGGRPRHIADR